LPTAVLAAGGKRLTHLNVGWHVTGTAANKFLRLPFIRIGSCSSIVALLMFFGCEGLQTATAEGETRTISLHHIHTNEDLTVTYKINGRYDEKALGKIDQLLRDWRADKPIRMDPHLIDLLWEVHREVGAKEPIWIVCGYRSPSTNSALRKRSSGVAKFSQHMQGKAIDFYIPGVPLDQLRAAGLRAQRGGVGYYPSSGAPFVHLDVAGVRHWPRMPEAQLASVLSKGQLNSQSASDPKGTKIAKGEIVHSSRKPTALAKLSKEEDEEADAARAAPANAAAPTRIAKAETKAEPKAEAKIEAKIEAKVEAKVEAKAGAKIQERFVPKPETNATATPEAEDESTLVVSAISSDGEARLPAPKPANSKATAGKTKATAQPATAAKSKPAQPTYELASADRQPTAPAATTSAVDRGNATANDVINDRGYWQGTSVSEPAEPVTTSRVAPSTPPRRVATASAGATTTASITRWPFADRSESEPLPNALSYAAQPTPIATARTLPMGGNSARPAAPPAHGDATVVAKRSDDRVPMPLPGQASSSPAAADGKPGTLVRVGDRFNDPWMRALIVSPSAQNFLKTTMFGTSDFRNLSPYLHKPGNALTLAFSDDPQAGMKPDSFAGSAVTFVSTVPFR
jgi:uncharacterized protein YcbK (DUF882 family)